MTVAESVWNRRGPRRRTAPRPAVRAAVAVALTVDGGRVRSRHGLTFLPRGDVSTAAPGLDRLLVPGFGAATIRGVPQAFGGPVPEYVHDRPGFAFDLVITDLARSVDVATAGGRSRFSSCRPTVSSWTVPPGRGHRPPSPSRSPSWAPEQQPR